MQNDELRRIHAELEVSQRRYFDLFDLAPVGYVNIDGNGVILDANLAFACLLGSHRKELEAQPLSRFIFPADQDNYYLFRKQLLETKTPKALDLRMNRKDLTTVWANMNANITQKLDGTEIFHITLTDISQRKQAEKEREELQAQLHQARKMEAIGRLAGGVAHDFNNNLGIILGHADFALNKMDQTHPLHTNILQILQVAQRSADLTGQLLAFARKQPFVPEVLNLNETIGGMLKMLRRLIGENIILDWVVETDLGLVKADPSQIAQILTNLCVNAKDAITNVGKITIHAENVNSPKSKGVEIQDLTPGDYVLLTISDNGSGMSQETLDNIFEPFFTTKGVEKGAGLGLSTVYGVVKQNNGSIDVRSEPGKGTTFRIYLPRFFGAPESVQVQAGIAPTQQGTETILVVEDEPSLLDVLKAMLENAGYRVLTAQTPDEALLITRKWRGDIHILITDVIMPNMNGLELAEKLQALFPKMKQLFMSGYTADIITQQGKLNAGLEFIQKPFSAKKIVAKVKEILSK
ncbi:MAG: response regulator [Candidatus Riflebacteria bacterium]|nr:response regulator [Candidatus Riflebacteria bacterium]